MTLADSTTYFAEALADAEAERARARHLATQVETNGKSIWQQDARMDSPVEQLEARSWLVLPLGSGEDRLGVLGLISRTPNAFAATDREFFALVAERVSLALEGARRSAELERLAFHDALTGLPNRELLTVRLEQALRRAAATDAPAALLFLDLDRFKEINDTFGHRYGDVVLQQIGLRLAAELPASATLARLAGDEFAVLLPDADAAEASNVAESLLRALARTVQVHDVTLDVGASIGVAAAPEHATQPDILLRQADVAMYVAKRRRGGYVVYSPDQDTHSRERLELAADLRGVIERGELRLHYQPIVSLETGHMDEVEALVRWEHPQRGLVSPGEFIPIAEETGMIIPIGRWVIEQACRQAVSWRERFGAARSLVVSVNLSARQFHHSDVPADISKILRDTGMDPRSLKLEITESIAMGDTELNIATLWLLKGMGLRLAIDDFGTGYSSLGYLKRFPVETLKIDKGFVDGLGVHPEDTAVIGAIIAFARAVGLSTTAEGVEDADQLVRLRELGADRVQGYYCSKPIPAEALEALLFKPRPMFQHLERAA
jgi:diguanylate cyclase (GGDEF)-like protein